MTSLAAMKMLRLSIVTVGLVAIASFLLINYASAGNKNCDPAYPSVCIASPPPDLDCKDIPYQNFKVLPADPHRFDGDYDGIGCERQKPIKK